MESVEALSSAVPCKQLGQDLNPGPKIKPLEGTDLGSSSGCSIRELEVGSEERSRVTA